MTKLTATYDKRFYDSFSEIARESAAALSPEVVRLVGPSSVVDVGCGRGYWLQAFQNLGVTKIAGFDGGDVSSEDLVIPAETFTSLDFRRLAEPGQLESSTPFDLAVCLEVAEHLPRELAPVMVRKLCQLAPTVLFSAAIPGQEGTGHINLQWPTYWSDLFAIQGYEVYDPLRLLFWEDERVAWWYRQNVILLCRRDAIPAGLAGTGPSRPLRLVHPELYASKDPAHLDVRTLVSALPRRVLKSLQVRISH